MSLTADFQNVSKNFSIEILKDWNLVTLCAQGAYPLEFHAH